LAICSLKPAVKEVFDISGFSQLIEVCPDRAAALAKMPA
jgi:anti-anti-sigma regulatory factor